MQVDAYCYDRISSPACVPLTRGGAAAKIRIKGIRLFKDILAG